MLGFVGRKTHEAALLAAQQETERLANRLAADASARAAELQEALARKDALLDAQALVLLEVQGKAEADLASAKETEQELQKQSNELVQALLAKTEALDTQARALLEVHAASEAAQENARRAEQLRLEAEAKARLAEAEKEAADIRCRAVEAECARVCACHAGRVRIFVMPLDPLEMTARARAVVGDVRIAWSADEKALVGDSGRLLTDAEYNGVVAAIMPRPDRT